MSSHRIHTDASSSPSDKTASQESNTVAMNELPAADKNGNVSMPYAFMKEIRPWCACPKCTHWLAIGCPCCTGCIQSMSEDDGKPVNEIRREILEMSIARRDSGAKPYYPNAFVMQSMCTIL